MKNKDLAIETLFNAINDKVKENWYEGTNVSHDIAVLVTLAKNCGLVDEWQCFQLFHEADAGYQLTNTFLKHIGL